MDSPITTAAQAACEAGYKNDDLNRQLAILVHNGFATKTLREGKSTVQKSMEACSVYAPVKEMASVKL